MCKQWLMIAVGVVACSTVAQSQGTQGEPVAERALSFAAGDFVWPGWRGPNRDGHVAGFRPLQVWPQTLRKVWQVEVGAGYGSPLVAVGRVYQHARQGDDEVLWCFDLDSGKTKWRQSYAAPFKMGGGGERHGKGPKSSPLFADGRIFTFSITGVLSAWDADSGDLLWRCAAGDQFKSSHPYWGAATSPIVDGNRVIVHFGTDEEGALMAIDVQNGDPIWSLEGDGPSYSSPLLADIDGIRQVVQWNHRALVGVESATGRKLWEYPFPHVGSDQNMPTPCIQNGQIILGGENRGIHSVKPSLDNGVWSASALWHQDKVALDMSSAVINSDLLYGFSHYGSGRLFCLDPRSGEVLWQGPGRTGQNVAFLSIPRHVIALINDGRLQIIRADRDRLQEVASYRVAESETWAPPVLMQDGVLIKDKQSLTLWSWSAGAGEAE